jgi:hypothetical protein
MAKVRRKKTELPGYVAVLPEADTDIDIGRPLSYRRDLGLAYLPICRVSLEDGLACYPLSDWFHRPPRAKQNQIVAEADTFLGIVVRVERYRNSRPKTWEETPTVGSVHPLGPERPGGHVSAALLEGTPLHEEEKRMATRIEYIIAEARDEARTVRISRQELDNGTDEPVNVETLLTLRAIEGEPPSATVLEDCDSVFTKVGKALKDFDAAYISARIRLGIPFQWAAGDDSRILRAVSQGGPAT